MPVVTLRRRSDLGDRLRRRGLELAHARFDACPCLPRLGAGVIKFLHSLGGTIAAEPLPHRRQRRAPDLAGTDREIAVNEERFQRPE